MYSIRGRLINGYALVVGMRIGRGNPSTRRKPAPCHFLDHKTHMT
jgi:hypothetical protein